VINNKGLEVSFILLKRKKLTCFIFVRKKMFVKHLALFFFIFVFYFLKTLYIRNLSKGVISNAVLIMKKKVLIYKSDTFLGFPVNYGLKTFY